MSATPPEHSPPSDPHRQRTPSPHEIPLIITRTSFNEQLTNEMWGPSNILKSVLLWTIQWLYSKTISILWGGASKTTPTVKSSILTEGATSLAARIRHRKVTSFEVVQSYINRIQEINDILNCVVDERFEAALSEAKKADEEIRTNTTDDLWKERPLLGVPFTCPDGVGVEGLCNTMGTTDRQKEKAKEDARAITLMRAAGAIPVACTNVSEFCMLWETNNPVFGRSCNPYNTNRSSGGPFGGEASLIAACGSPLGVAPSGKVTCAFNGVFGHKPSGEISSVGPVSRNSVDLLPTLKILTKNPDLKLDQPVDVKRLKYYFTNKGNINEDLKAAIQRIMQHFRNIKAPVERVDIQHMEKSYLIWKLKTESFQTKHGKMNLLKELLMACFKKTHHTFLFLLTSIMDQTIRRYINPEELTGDLNSLEKTFKELLGSDGVFIYPAHPTSAFLHGGSFAREFDCGYSAVFDALGLPATYCPAGLDSDGLPIGVQVIGGVNQDRLTLAVGEEIEKVLGGWKPPPSHGTFTLKSALFHTSTNEKVKIL